MKSDIAYWSKKDLVCSTYKSDAMFQSTLSNQETR